MFKLCEFIFYGWFFGLVSTLCWKVCFFHFQCRQIVIKLFKIIIRVFFTLLPIYSLLYQTNILTLNPIIWYIKIILMKKWKFGFWIFIYKNWNFRIIIADYKLCQIMGTLPIGMRDMHLMRVGHLIGIKPLKQFRFWIWIFIFYFFIYFVIIKTYSMNSSHLYLNY